MKASEYQDIGQYLRDSRESLHISLEQAADELHIRPHYLKAIETGSVSQLPGQAYIRGYLRNYVSYLGLAPKEVLEAYDTLYGKKKVKFFKPELTQKQNQPPKHIIWGALAGILLLYAYWYFAVHDRSIATYNGTDIPEEFAHFLDKKPAINMRENGENISNTCLDTERIDCFIFLPEHSLPDHWRALYDTYPSTTPQEP